MFFLKLDNIYFKYQNNDKWILKDVNLKIEQGEYVCILGRSGSGKSTLVKILNGLIPNIVNGEYKGNTLIDGFKDVNDDNIILKNISKTVFQNPEFQLINNFVYEELSNDSNCDYYLEVFGISDLKFKRICELSSGEKQKIVIASVFSYKPHIVILDEPASNLDESSQQLLWEYLKNIKNKNNITVVIIEHQIEKIKHLIDKFYFIENSKLEEISGDVLEEKVLPPLCKCKVLSEFDSPILEVKNVSYSNNCGFKLNDISFHLNYSEILGLTGPNGSGKSTIANIVMKIKKPMFGEVLFKGKKIKNNKGEIGLVVQNPLHQIFCTSVYDEICFAPRNFKSFSKSYLDKITETFGLTELLNCSPLTLSFGEQERTAIASVFSYQPEVIIIDEPTLGQDDITIKNIMGFILKERKKGKSFLIISHNKNILNRICDRILILKNGILTTAIPEK